MRVGLCLVEKGATPPSGVHRYAANVLRALRTAPEVDELVLLTHDNLRIADFLTPADLDGVEVVHYRPWWDNAITAHAWHLVVLPRLVRRYRLDLVHITNGRPSRSAGVPLLVTLHDLAELEIEDKFDPVRLAYRRWVQHGFMRRQRTLLTGSRTAQGDIARHLDRDPASILVIPHYALPTTRSGGEHNGGGDFVFVGRIDHPSKNLLLLIHAFDRFADEVPDVRLKLAGSDSWLAEVVHAAAEVAQHADRIDFLGWISDDELARLLNAAVALCQPSLHEGFGLPVAEALAHGTPVLAADAGALPEVLGTREGLLPADDPKAWADAMVQLHRSPACRSDLLAEQLAHYAFGGEQAQARVARLLVSVYESALTGHVSAA